MNLIKGRFRLFCVSNIIVSFACTGFLGPRYYGEVFEAGQNDNSIALTTDEIIPLSQKGEGEESIITKITSVPDIDKLVEKLKSSQKEEQKTVNKTTTKKVTTSVVTKKEVASSVKYTPAVYNEVTGNAVIEYAKKYMGLRYVSGGNSLTKGTDCSGFTKLIYKEFGITLPRTVSGQIGKGTYIKKSDLQKGDLVFYSGGGRYATHVGMYMGNGKVIHQSNPRDGVKISTVNMMHYITARRVINATAKKIAEQKLEDQKKIDENILSTNTTKEINNENVTTNIVNEANTESISNEVKSLESVSKENQVNTSNKDQVITSNETNSDSSKVMDEKKVETELTEEVKKETLDQSIVTNKEENTNDKNTKNDSLEKENLNETKSEQKSDVAKVVKEESKVNVTETKEEVKIETQNVEIKDTKDNLQNEKIEK